MIAPRMTYNLNECVEKLSLSGFPIGNEKLKQGLIQGKFSFGFAIEGTKGNYDYVIFKKDVEDFILMHGGEVRQLISERNALIKEKEFSMKEASA